MVSTITLLLLSPPARADFWGGDVVVLAKILAQNIKDYQQFREMVRQDQNMSGYLRAINKGLANSIGLLGTLPVRDDQILAGLNDFKEATKEITKIYGRVPKSTAAALELLNDRTVAESLQMATSFKQYSAEQETNSALIIAQAPRASLKGAARMQAQTSGEILASLSQLIRLNTQMLKLQSEQLAMNNKHGKDQVASFQKVNRDLGDGFKNFKLNTSLAKF